MSQNRSATARFLKGPFTLKIAGGGSGTGSGRVRSQTGLSPAINCAITSGTAAASGCSASYPGRHRRHPDRYGHDGPHLRGLVHAVRRIRQLPAHGD